MGVPARSLVVLGVLSAIATGLGYGLDNTVTTFGQEEVVTAVLSLISFGYVSTGVLWFREQEAAATNVRSLQLPALTLIAVAITTVVGTLFVFQPWQYRGFAATATTLLTGFLAVVAIGLVVVGITWARRREPRYPLALLTGILAVGLFHRLAQQVNPTLPVPVVAVLVVVIAVVPPIIVLSQVPAQSSVS